MNTALKNAHIPISIAELSFLNGKIHPELSDGNSGFTGTRRESISFYVSEIGDFDRLLQEAGEEIKIAELRKIMRGRRIVPDVDTLDRDQLLLILFARMAQEEKDTYDK